MVVELLAAGASKAASHTLLNGSRAGKGRQVLARFFFAALALGACSRRLGSLGRLCSEGEEIQERSVRVARVRRVQQEKPMKNGATPLHLASQSGHLAVVRLDRGSKEQWYMYPKAVPGAF